jgi:hypothetical protein
MCIGWLAPAQGADPNQFDYTLPAIGTFASTGPIGGLTKAYMILDEGINDTSVTGDKRQLILLHAAARAAMLVVDTGDVAVDTSVLDVVEPFGITITGTKFFSIDPCDPELIQLVLPTDPDDPNCLVIPPGADPIEAAAAINNDATLGGVFPGWTQQTWIPYGFDVWATNTNYFDDPRAWYIFRNPDEYGFAKLGASNGGNLTVSGSYQYYVIAARGMTLVDSVRRGPSGSEYYTGSLYDVGDVANPAYILGAPDGLFATVGDTFALDLGQDPYSSSVVLTNPGGWTGLTVITGGATTVATGAASPAQVVANGTTTSTITITVKDSFGNPIPGVDVVLSTTPEGPDIDQPGGPTNTSGQTTGRIASTTAGTYRVDVTINVDGNDVTFTEVATVVFKPGPANRLVFTTQPAASYAADASIAPVVTVKDAQGNIVTSPPASITMTAVPSATLHGTNPVTTTSGAAAFSLTIQQAGVHRLKATYGGITALSNEFTVIPQASSAHLVFGPQPATSPAIGAIAGPPTVTVKDTYGNEGLAAGSNVVIRETLPTGLEFVSATDGGTRSGGVITWNVGSVPAETNGLTVEFVARVTDALADGGIITNSNPTITAQGMTPVSQVTPETTTVNDRKPPQVSGQIPGPNSVGAARDTMIRLHVTDGGSGVDFGGGTVRIFVEGDLIYDGSAETSEGQYDTTGDEQAVRGVTRRTGDPNDYTFTFLPSTQFQYEQQVNVTVEVADLAGNEDTVDYLFFTQTRMFGANVKVNSDAGTAVQDNPAVAVEPNGAIWVVWDQRATLTSDAGVYFARLPADGTAFEPSVRIFNDPNNQVNPATAADSIGRLYVVWEQWGTDDLNHHIMLTSSADDGATWSEPARVDPDPAEGKPAVMARNPSIAVSATDQVYVAWEETIAGADSDIWLRSFTQGGGFDTATQITTDPTNQTEPIVRVDSGGVVYVVWTDARNAGTTGTDIFSPSPTSGRGRTRRLSRRRAIRAVRPCGLPRTRTWPGSMATT